MSPWRTLYIPTSDAATLADRLIAALNQNGYQLYDPFPGGDGTPIKFKPFVKLFASPLTDGYVRLIGEFAPEIVPVLSADQPVLLAWATDADSGIDVYQGGQKAADSGAALSAYLRPGHPADELARILQGALPPRSVGKSPAKAGKPSDLPDEIQQLARDRNVNLDQANRMFNRLTAQIFGKMDQSSGGQASAMQGQARSLLSGGPARVDWESVPGRKLQALADLLALPTNWREPEFEALRDAYQAARMLRRNPKATLMDDEKATLSALPNALEYRLLYAGK